MRLLSTKQMWVDYRDSVGVPKGGTQERETRRAFYGAQHALLQLMKRAVGEMPEADGVAYLETLEAEHVAFKCSVLAGEA